MLLKSNIGPGIDEHACTMSHVMRWGMSVFVDDGETNDVCIDDMGRKPVQAQPHSSLCMMVQLSSPTTNGSAAIDRKHIDSLAW